MKITHFFRANTNDITQLGNNQINAFQTRFFQAINLFLDDSFKSHIGGEQSNANTCMRSNKNIRTYTLFQIFNSKSQCKKLMAKTNHEYFG